MVAAAGAAAWLGTAGAPTRVVAAAGAVAGVGAAGRVAGRVVAAAGLTAGVGAAGEAAAGLGSAGYLAPRASRGPRLTVRQVLAEIGTAIGVAGVIAMVGVPTGWLWSLLAPRVEVVSTPDGVLLADSEPSGFIGAEATFVAMGLVLGVVVAVLGWLVIRRFRGPVLLVGLVAGSMAAGYLAWRSGHAAGSPDYYRYLLDHAPPGWRFYIPPDLRMADRPISWLPRIRGAVAVQALAAAFTYTVIAGWSRYAALRRTPADDHPDR